MAKTKLTFGVKKQTRNGSNQAHSDQNNQWISVGAQNYRDGFK
jgi:hypothetical protein